MLRDEAVLVRSDHSSDLAAVLANRIEARDRQGSGPRPWLPPVPRQVDEDDFWHRYFDRRAELIHRHGDAICASASTWTEQTAPGWAVPTLHEPNLTRDLAIWRAGHEVADSDLRPTGPPTSGVKNGYQQQRLDRRISDAGAMPAKANVRIAQLGEILHPGITTDPHWPTLAQLLYVADREGPHDAQLRRIATARPLPIDQPASALAYRLVDAIGERTPTNTTPALPATARSTACETAPARAHGPADVRAAAAVRTAARLRAHLRIGAAIRPAPVAVPRGRRVRAPCSPPSRVGPEPEIRALSLRTARS